MAKRTDGKFKRREADYYATPASAVTPLIPHLCKSEKFCEPFAGNGALAFALEDAGFEMGNWSDLYPKPQDRYAPIPVLDVMLLTEEYVSNSAIFITNSPWPMPRAKGQPTVGMIKHLVKMRPLWMLLSADFCHNVYWKEIGGFCEKIVSVGRVSWMGNNVKGFDNAAWYLFDCNRDPEYNNLPWANYSQFYGNS